MRYELWVRRPRREATKQLRKATKQRGEATKQLRKHIFSLVNTTFVSIFAEIQMLSNAFIPELKYRLYFWKCRPRSEDSVEMEQLKSHLRAGRHECQFYFTYSRAFLVLCLNCFAGCRPRLFCSNSLLSHRTDCRFFQLMLPK